MRLRIDEIVLVLGRSTSAKLALGCSFIVWLVLGCSVVDEHAWERSTSAELVVGRSNVVELGLKGTPARFPN